MSNNQTVQPIIYAVILIAGISFGQWWVKKKGSKRFGAKTQIEQVMSLVSSEYVDTVNQEKIEEQAINELLASFDPHSIYIPSKFVERANQDLKGKYRGIGIEFSLFSDTPYIVRVIKGGPAERAGILAGDRILKVDKLSCVNKKTSDLVQLIKGEKGSNVELEIYRKSVDSTKILTMQRASISQKSVFATLLSSGVLYIKILRFAGPTHDEFVALVEKYENQQAISKVIIDLRNNGGGYLHTAINLLDEFIDGKQLLVSTDGKGARSKKMHSKPGGILVNAKLVCLINENSASASEIFSGTIQDLDRGLILGQKSFGKGLVQETFRLTDGAQIRLTVSRYYMPSGRSIQKPYNNEGYIKDSGAHSFDQVFYTKKLKRKVYAKGGVEPDMVLNETANRLHRSLTNRVTTLAAGFIDSYYGLLKLQDINTWRLPKNLGKEYDKYISEFPELKNLVRNRINYQIWGEEASILELGKSDSWVEKAVEELLKSTDLLKIAA